MASYPVTILTGFLGSGKSTLLNRVLASNHGRRVAVIVNEFGEIGIDSHLIEGVEDGFLELDNGCLCCALSEDLVDSLGALAERGGIEQILIETTGIAEPGPIAATLNRPELCGLFSLDAVVTTVDALEVERALQESVEAESQIRDADFCVLTKLDLAKDGRREEVEAIIQNLNERAQIVDVDEDAVMAVLLEPRLDGARAGMVMAAPEVSQRRAHPLHRDPWTSLSVDVGARVTIRLCLEEFLQELPPAIYRAKGFVKLDGERGRLLFHRVGQRVDMEQREEFDGPGQLVFIGRDFDREALREEVESLFEEI